MLQSDARSRAFGRVIAVSTTAALVVGGVSLAALPASAAPFPGSSAQALEVQLPVIVGTVAVGQTVHALIVVDVQADDLLGYQWKRNGVAIAGATGAAYTPTVADYGTNLTVSVTVSLLTVPIATVTSAAATVGPGVIPLSPYPTVTGNATVGSVLAGTPGTWTLNTRLSYQWYRGATAIAGATALSYTLAPADLGSQVSLVTRGELTGFIASERASDPTAVVAAGALGTTSTPTVTGSPVVGATLEASTGAWDAGVTFTYQWKRGDDAIPGATDSSYTLVAADLGSPIRVTVTGSKTGYIAQSRSSLSTDTVAAGTISPAPVPTVSGAFAFDQELTAHAGTWADGTVLSYAWLRDGEPIAGATSDTYTLGTDDIGASITVAVTGQLAGYVTRTRTSAPSAPVAEAMIPVVGTPTVTGTAKVGSTLTAHTGTWSSGVAFDYSWFRGATPIAGADESAYTLTPADAGALVHVVVTGALDGYAALSVASDPTSSIDLGTLVAPTDGGVTGSLVVGSTLTADPGDLPDDAEVAYQWLRDGVEIDGATGKTYALTTDDDGAQISVDLVVSLAGYAPLAFSLDTTGTVSTIDIPVVGTPSVSGSLVVGSTLTAQPGTWSSGTTFTYQWTRDTTPVAGATGTTYLLGADDLGASIAVTVTGSRAGNSPVDRTTTGSAPIAAGTLVQTGDASVDGSLAVGETLSADPGDWPAGTTFAYEWLRGSDVIPGAEDSSYELTTDDLGASIAVRITASKPGYTALPVTVAVDGVVAAQVLPVSSTPTISGTPAVGRTLTAVVGDWTGDTTFSYVWKRDGSPIPGATGGTYDLVAADRGHDISVTVTGSNPPYASVTRTSAPTVSVATGSITGAPVPAIAGTASVGSTLQATAGSWPAGVTLAYQWLRGSALIPGATGTSYVPTAADVASTLRVRVTGSRTGYADRATTSVPTAAVTAATTPGVPSTPGGPGPSAPSDNASITQAPTPVISGTTTYQKVLTATAGTWDAGVTLSYQWLRGGVPIAGATGLTYKLALADIGKRLSVVVTGSRPDSANVSVSSAPTAKIAERVFKRSPAPRITGTVSVGSKLTAKVQKWHKGVKFTYQWKANGKKIAKATHSTYRLAAKVAGKKITVTITAKLSGYKTLAKVSKKTVRVAR